MNFQIQAFDKLPDINRKNIIYYFGFFFGAISLAYILRLLISTNFNLLLVFTTIWINDLILLVSVSICSVIIFTNLYTKPKEIEIFVLDDGFAIGNWTYKTTDILAYSIIDLGTYFEFILKTRDFRTPFVYFYLPAIQNNDAKKLMLIMSQLYNYQSEIEDLDRFHVFFRKIGLK
jgi:hypothetical protein